MPRFATHIGIAFYAADRLPSLAAIVISNDENFKTIELRGTVMETVNGWVESWCQSGRSPAVFEPYLRLEGILHVAKVAKSPGHVSASISEMRWRPQNVRIDHDTAEYIHPYSTDYVCRALSHLCGKTTISILPNVMGGLSGCMLGGLFCIREERLAWPRTFRPDLPDSFPVFPLETPEDIAQASGQPPVYH
jgi:hypothetical protein